MRKLWFKASVTVILLAGVAWRVPWDELWDHARQIGASTWTSVLAVVALAHLLGVWKWSLALGRRVGLRALDAVQCYSAGLFANLFLPSIVGGDALRAILAGRLTKRYEAVVFGGLADRLSDVLALVLLATAGAIAAKQAAPDWVAGAAMWMALAGTVVAVFAVVGVRRACRRSARVRRAVRRALVAARRLWREPARAALVLSCSLAIQCVFALLNAWIGHSVGIDVVIGVWFFAFPFCKLVSLLPISIAGFGVREASLTAALVVADVPAEQAVLVALVWSTILIATSLLAGAGWFLLDRWQSARTGGGNGSLLEVVRAPR